MIGHDYPQIDYLATERLREYHRSAETYRRSTEGRRPSVSEGGFARWLGTVLLELGRRMRERGGDVIVQIAFQPKGRDRAA